MFTPPQRTLGGIMGKNRFLKIIADTGFGFSFVSFLFYSTNSTLGMCVALASLLLIAAIKLQHDTTSKAWIKDPRTPLRISGVGLLLIAFGIMLQSTIGTAAASSIATLSSTHLSMAPFFSALFFGTANMLMASQLASPCSSPLPFTRNPETYLFLGYITIGIMSGMGAVHAMPLVALAFAVTMYNYAAHKSVCNCHPLLIYALAELCFAVVALQEGKTVIAIADILCAVCLLRVDLALRAKEKQPAPLKEAGCGFVQV